MKEVSLSRAEISAIKNAMKDRMLKFSKELRNKKMPYRTWKAHIVAQRCMARVLRKVGRL